MATKNPISRLMEWSQVHPEQKFQFSIPYSCGESHNMRFLCVWMQGTAYLPGVFSKSKKEGKTQSAMIALESLEIQQTCSNRDIVHFKVSNGRCVPVCTDTIDDVVNTNCSGMIIKTMNEESTINRTMLSVNDNAHLPPPSGQLNNLVTPEISREYPAMEQLKIITSPDVDKRNASCDIVDSLPSNIQSASMSADKVVASSSVSSTSSSLADSPSQLLSTTKNPISTLNEIGQRRGIQLKFEIISQEGPSHSPMFTCRGTFGDVTVEVKASSKTKAKYNVSKLVLSKLSDEMDCSSVSGSSLVESETSEISEGLPSVKTTSDKNPISALMELGSRMSVQPKFEIVDTLNGFKATCTFQEQTYGPIQGANKKEAKTSVAEYTLSKLLEDEKVNSTISAQKFIINSSDAGYESYSASTDHLLNSHGVQSILGQKHPVSAFYEWAQRERKSARIVEAQPTRSHAFQLFAYQCVYDGKMLPIAEARTKKEAQKHAAELAMRELISLTSSDATSSLISDSGSLDSGQTVTPVCPEDESWDESLPSSTSQTRVDIKSKQDIIATTVLKKFEELRSSKVRYGKIVLAGFVMEKMVDNEIEYNTVSIGIGNTVIRGEKLSREGNYVNDCHAEVIARRGLLRFLYSQIMLHDPDSEDSVYIKNSTGKLKLKDTIKFHLYISTAPCGDSAIFSHNETQDEYPGMIASDKHQPITDRSTYGILRCKVESGEGTIPPPKNITDGIQQLDGIQRGDRLYTMSCSDKICKWNVLGLQGTLLSNFLEPVYINTIVLGQLFQPGHLARALCCRVKHLDAKLKLEKSSFKVNHPNLAVAGSETARSNLKSGHLSMNWCEGDEKPEFLDSSNGNIIDVGDGVSVDFKKISQISRQALYKIYKEVCDYLGKSFPQESDYLETKNSISEYTTMKEVLYQDFKTRGSIWMRKPPELGSFRIDSCDTMSINAKPLP